MMRKALSVFLSMFCVLFATAQDLTVRSMEALPFDTYASVHKRLDLNQNPCAVVRVSLPVSGATFSGNVIGDVSRDGSDYLVYMPAGSKKIWVKHPNYHELEVIFGNYGIERLESLATYRVTVNVPQSVTPQQKMQTLTVKVTPADAIVQIDGDIVEGTAIALSVGTHRYNVVSRGYYPQEGTVEVNEKIPAKLVIELDRKTTPATTPGQSVAVSAQTQPQSQPQPQQPVSTSQPAQTQAVPVSTSQSTASSATPQPSASATTSPTTGTHNGHEYVDLGLSVKWATCNVGAASPEDCGDYFAWGETSPKSEYRWENLKYRTKGDSYKNVKFSKYVAERKHGTVDNKTVLDLSDDAARANWGGSWRMPTISEFQELIDKCIWTWTTMNGMNGYKIESKMNGSSLFLPTAGDRGVTSLDSAGSFGYYWSSSLYESSSDVAWILDFGSGHHDLIPLLRYVGQSVRPVLR